MGDITRTTWTDDSGGGTDGTILNNAELQAIYDAIELDTRSANHPTVSLASLTDTLLAGIPFFFGGSSSIGGLPNTAYSAGAATIHPETGVLTVDSILLQQGTYALAGIAASGDGIATATIALINLTDAPTTAMVTFSGTASTVGQSGSVTWPATGTEKNYGIKAITSDGAVNPFGWGLWLRRTA